MALLATGELVTGVRIEGSGGATPAKVYDLTLADVAVTKVADGEDGYSLSLDYGKIALSPRASMQPASQPRTASSATTSSTTSRSTRSRWP